MDQEDWEIHEPKDGLSVKDEEVILKMLKKMSRKKEEGSYVNKNTRTRT